MSAPIKNPLLHQKLISTWLLLTLTATLLVIFIVLRPSKSDFFNEHYLTEPDGLSIAYLRLLLDAQPENKKIRWALAHQLRVTGFHVQALEVLSPLLPRYGSSYSSKIFETYFELLWSTAVNSKMTEREKLEFQIVRLYGTLLEQDWPIMKIRKLLDFYGERLPLDDVLPVYEDFRNMVSLLLKSDDYETHPEHKHWKYEYKNILLQLDRFYLSKADLEKAIEVNTELLQIAASEAEQVQYAQRLVKKHLWNANPYKALEYIRPLIKYDSTDLSLLRLGVDVARQSNDQKMARQWLRQVLTIDPSSNEDWIAFFETTVGSGEHLKALGLVPKLQSLGLYSIDIQRQVAYLYQWTEQPRRAYEQWKHVMEQTNDQSDERNTWLLAVALFDHEAVDRLLGAIRSRRPLDGIEMHAYIDNLIKIGDSGGAIEAVEEAIVSFPERRLFYQQGYRVLADEFQFREAAEIMEKMRDHFELRTDEVIMLSNLYWIVRDTGKALEALQEFFSKDPDYDKDYWVLRTQLALLEFDDEDAIKSWLEVARYPLSEIEYEIFYQVLAISYGINNYVVSAQLAKSGYDIFGEATLLMDAMEFYSHLGQFDEVKVLIEIAQTEEPSLINTAPFFKILAMYSEHYGDLLQARKYWQSAVSVETNNEEYVLPWLWFLVNNHRYFGKDLIVNLNYYSAINSHDESWFDVFAYGYGALGEHEVALSWFLEGLESRSHNWSWLMGLASSCFETGRYEVAYQIRGVIYRQMVQAYNESGLVTDGIGGLATDRQLGGGELDARVPGKPLTIDQFTMLLSLQDEFSGTKVGLTILNDQIEKIVNMPDFWKSQLPQQIYAYSAAQGAHQWSDQLAHIYRRKGVKISESASLVAALRKNDLEQVRSILNLPFGLSVTERMQGYGALGYTRRAHALGLSALRSQKVPVHANNIRRLNAGFGRDNTPDWAFFHVRSGGAGSFVTRKRLRRRVVTDRYKLDMEAIRDEIDLVLENGLRPVNPARVNHLTSLKLTRRISLWGEITAGIGVSRRGDHDVGQAEISYAYTGSTPLTYRLRAYLNVEAVDSSILRAVAQHSGVQVHGRYALDGRFSLSTQASKDYYELFSGEALGDKFRIGLRADYRLLKSRPFLSVYGQLYMTDYSWDTGAETSIRDDIELMTSVAGNAQTRFLPSDNSVASIGFQLAKGSTLSSLQNVAVHQWSLSGELGFDTDAEKFAWSLRSHARWQLSSHMELGLSIGWQRSPIESEANWDSTLSLVIR